MEHTYLSKRNCYPGILYEVLDFLKLKSEKLDNLKNVSLVFDCMVIWKGIYYNVGYVDFGEFKASDHEQLATEPLFF